MIDISRTRYNALLELIAEQFAAGQQPNAAWVQEIEAARAMHPDWVAPPPVVVVVPPPPPPPSVPPRAAVPLNPNERTPIMVDEEMERIAKEVLAAWGSRFCVFQSGGRLFEVQTDATADMEFLAREPDSPRMVMIGPARARALASKTCRFGKSKTLKDGTQVLEEQLPPDWLGSTITTRIDFPNIPVFAALAQAPTLRRDGALICEPGYDRSTGIYLAGDLEVSVPTSPTQEDARQAVVRLLDLVCDFDFVNPAGKSVWLSGLLAIACRHTFNGPAPIIIIDASKRGSGKTRLIDMISIIATGRKAPRMVYTTDDTEMDKRITSLGLASEQVVLIDNIVGKLASPSLDAALTSDSYRGRVLGKTEMTPSMPMKIVWFATGNGVIIGADTARRAILARLEPPVDHPEHRTGPRPGVKWRYPNLLDHVQRNRASLLSDALTIVSAYIRAGRPAVQFSVSHAAMGSFEEWTDTIRAALVWAGAVDPCDTIKDAQAADVEDLALRTMVENWPVADGVAVTTATLIKRAELTMPAIGGDSSNEMWRNALLEWLPARGSAPLPTARELGVALRAIKGSIIGNFKIEAGTHTRSGTPWARVRVGGESEPAETEPVRTGQSLFTVIK